MRKLLPILSLISILVLSGCACMQQPEPMAKPAPAPARPAPAPVVKAATYSPQAIMIEKMCPPSVFLNVPYEYKIKATNMTNQLLSEVQLEDRLPANFKYISSSPEGTLRGSVLTWILGEMKPDESRIITVKGQATETGELRNCASATYKFYNCAQTVVVQPSLKLVKTAPAEVSICDPIPMKFTVTNTGTGDATNVKVTDELPAGLKLQEGGSSIALAIGTLPAGRSAEKTVMVKADRTGVFENRAVAAADGNLRADSNATRTKVTQPILTIDKKVSRDWEYGGRRVEYTITVANKGDGAAANTVVTDTVPAGVEQVQASGGGTQSGGLVTWNVGNLAPGASKQFTVSYVPNTLGRLTNTATAKAVCAQDVSKSAAIEIRGIPALLLEVIDVADPIELGHNETYVITVTNQGSATATNIKIACTLEDTMEFVSADGATQGSAVGPRVTFAPLASLNSKAKATWRVVVKGVSRGDARFGVVLNADQLDRDVQETESTHFYE